MKKVVVIVVMFLTFNNAFSQKELLTKFENNEDVKTIVVNKKLFTLLDNLKPEIDDSTKNRKSEIESLKVFITENGKVTDQMKTIVNQYVKSSDFEQLMNLKTEKGSAKVMVKSGKSDNQIEEFLIFIEGDNKNKGFLLSLSGLIEL